MKRAVVLLSGGIDSTTTLAIAIADGYEAYALSFDYGQRHEIDYSGYPDCRPEFIEAFEDLANLGTKAGVEGRRIQIHTPLIKFSKADIIRKAVELGVELSLTHSCYDPTPEGLACGECDSCLLRLKGFREAGIKDPIRYVK